MFPEPRWASTFLFQRTSLPAQYSKKLRLDVSKNHHQSFLRQPASSHQHPLKVQLKSSTQITKFVHNWGICLLWVMCSRKGWSGGWIKEGKHITTLRQSAVKTSDIWNWSNHRQQSGPLLSCLPELRSFCFFHWFPSKVSKIFSGIRLFLFRGQRDNDGWWCKSPQGTFPQSRFRNFSRGPGRLFSSLLIGVKPIPCSC